MISPMFDQVPVIQPSIKIKPNKKLAETLSKLHQLHDELNKDLYACPAGRPVIHSPCDIKELILPFMMVLDHEELWVANLDTRNRVRSLTKLYQGSINTSMVRVCEVFRQAIIENAPSIILIHNHPSGDPSPSPEDITLTHSVRSAGKLLDIDVLDHVIIGGKTFKSLKEAGISFS